VAEREREREAGASGGPGPGPGPATAERVAGGPAPWTGRGVVVTGGTRGLGRALVTTLARRGARVVFCGRAASEAAGREVEAEAAAAANEAGSGGAAWFVAADVSSEPDVERLFDQAAERFDRLDLLVNNAGILGDGLLLSTTLDTWNQVMATNLRGAFLCTRRAIDELLGGGGGRIVNVSSIAANGSVGQAAYAASKSAILSFTRSVAKEYGRRGIACNAVVPGWLDTDMTTSFAAEARRAREELSPHRRFGRADEVVEAILFLGGEEASFVNGDALYVAGAVRDVPPLR
jgi:3-oxoacyl-[acyl-carrier protein] reductase